MIPGLTKWRIYQAFSMPLMLAKAGPFLISLNPVMTAHFTDFISRPCVLRDVAYSTRKMKPDSGGHAVEARHASTVLTAGKLDSIRQAKELSLECWKSAPLPFHRIASTILLRTACNHLIHLKTLPVHVLSKLLKQPKSPRDEVALTQLFW